MVGDLLVSNEEMRNQAPRNSILLGVNIDHAATLRQARYRGSARSAGEMVEPDPLFIALLAERAGADGITVHLREDRRHIQERDVWRLRESISTRLNLEMACTPEMVKLAVELKPDSVCLVPEGRDEVTTEGGLDVVGQVGRVRSTAERLMEAGMVVSLFIEPEPEQIDCAREIGGRCVELHTGAYANAYYGSNRGSEFERLRKGCERAALAGLVVNAGHGINYVNISEIRTLPNLHELNIGHSILSRSITVGIEGAVREMRSKLG